MFKPTYDKHGIEIVKRKTVYQGYYAIYQYQLRHRLFAGGWSRLFTREVLERGKAVAVLLFDPHLNKIVLIEQLRSGIVDQTNSPWLLEVVAGIIDTGENTEQVAARETKEETGLVVSNLLPVCNYWVSPAASTESMSLFCGQVDATQAGGVYGLQEENEDIRVHVFDLQDAYALLAAGCLRHAPAIISLQWLQLHEKSVREKFGA